MRMVGVMALCSLPMEILAILDTANSVHFTTTVVGLVGTAIRDRVARIQTAIISRMKCAIIFFIQPGVKQHSLVVSFKKIGEDSDWKRP
jgi:hypothetical protein